MEQLMEGKISTHLPASFTMAAPRMPGMFYIAKTIVNMKYSLIILFGISFASAVLLSASSPGTGA